MLLDLGPLGQQTLLSTTLLSVGALTLTYIAYTLTKVFLSTLVLPGVSLSKFGPKGSWAVVTGASDGIGKEYALQLAQKGFNVVLVSRTQSKLDAIASQIKSSSPSSSVETLSVDFSTASDAEYAALSKILEKKQVAVLVNNVGKSHDLPVSFAETPEEEMKGIINVNVTATLRVTQTVLPHMLPHKRGLILNMGSFAGTFPTPLLATYSGSKAFLQSWSTALASELAQEGITVHFIVSYLVTSSMSKVRRSNWQVPTEKMFVKSALSKVGRTGGAIGYPHTGAPYWSHSLVLGAMLLILGPFNQRLMEFSSNMQAGVRKRAIRRAGRDKKAS